MIDDQQIFRLNPAPSTFQRHQLDNDQRLLRFSRDARFSHSMSIATRRVGCSKTRPPRGARVHSDAHECTRQGRLVSDVGHLNS